VVDNLRFSREDFWPLPGTLSAVFRYSVLEGHLAASVVLTTKASGADQNGAITLSLASTQVKAAPASLSGGAGTTYDTGTVTANINGTAVSAGYGQTSTPQSMAAALATAITAQGPG
jgi:phage tail sheath gpL-like